MKRTLSMILVLLLAFSAVSFTAFAADDDLAESGLSEYPPHPEYSGKHDSRDDDHGERCF